MHAVCVFDHQLAAVVFFGRRKKERRRPIRPDAVRRARTVANRVVNVIAERLTALITIEKQRKNLERQSRRHNQRILFERGENHLAHHLRRRAFFRQLHIVFGPRRLVPGRYAPVNPFGAFEQAAAFGDLLGA